MKLSNDLKNSTVFTKLSPLYPVIGHSQNNNFLFIFHFAESETGSIISRNLRIWKFMFCVLKMVGIKIMHTFFHVDWTNNFEVLQKIAGSSFFLDHPVY